MMRKEKKERTADVSTFFGTLLISLLRSVHYPQIVQIASSSTKGTINHSFIIIQIQSRYESIMMETLRISHDGSVNCGIMQASELMKNRRRPKCLRLAISKLLT